MDQLYVEFSRPLEQIVRGGLQAPEAVVEEACQVAWTRLVRHRHRVTDAMARGWLTRTAVHEASRLMRRELREPPVDTDSHSELLRSTCPEPQQVLEQRQRLAAVGALPPRQQRLVWLRALGLSYEEMASHEGCTSRTVQRQLERARRRLRRLETGAEVTGAA